MHEPHHLAADHGIYASSHGEVLEPEILHDPYVYEREQRARYQRIQVLFQKPVFVTWVLIAICLVLYGWCLWIDHGLLDEWSGSPRVALYAGANWRPLVLEHDQWWRTLSSMYLHAGLLHIGFNVYALYILGPTVERLSGPGRFFVIIFVSGLVGSLASLFFNGNPSVGISGAVFGIVGALLGITRKFKDELPDPMAKSIRTAMIQIALINLLIGFMVPMIDNSAHVGGFVGGFVVALLMGSRLREGAKGPQLQRVAALVLAGVTLVAIGAMFKQSKDCMSSEPLFMQCYGKLLSASQTPPPDELK